jgi:3-oxoacyl-[acyl-carrier protein] reductase
MSKLAGKVAIVTGASKGIGAGIARAFAAEGAAVVVNYASSKAGADQVVDEILSNGGKALAVQGDVSRTEDVQRLFAETREQLGPVDVLVNNAGIYQFNSIETITEDDFHRQFNTNVLGTILATQEAVKQFGASGGSVINISSVASTTPMPTSTVYAATKSALDSITSVLAQELGGRNIRVNAIAPGVIDTEGARTAEVIGGDLEQMAVANTPLGRVGQTDDVARVAVFLASDDAGWVTGERIAAAGGFR